MQFKAIYVNQGKSFNNYEIAFVKYSGMMEEPQFNIKSNNDVWHCMPGKDNLYCAIVFFCIHLRKYK